MKYRPAPLETIAGAEAAARRLLGPTARVVFAKKNPRARRYLVGIVLGPGRMGVLGYGVSWAAALRRASRRVAAGRRLEAYKQKRAAKAQEAK